LEEMLLDFSEGINEVSTFKSKAQNIQDFLYNYLLQNNGLDNDLTPYEDMHPLVKIAFSKLSMSLLFCIYQLSENFSLEIESGNGEKYDTLELAGEYDKANRENNKKISNLIDAYIEAVKNGEIVIQEDNEAENSPSWVPTYTPPN